MTTKWNDHCHRVTAQIVIIIIIIIIIIIKIKILYTFITFMRATQPDHITHSIEQSTSWRSILILSSHLRLRLRLPSGPFPSVFPTKNLYAPLLSTIPANQIMFFH
jgi:hypothetical protein